MRRSVGLAFVALAGPGCAGLVSEQRVSSLEQRQLATEARVRVDERRAAHLRAEQLQRGRQLAVMNSCLEYASCEAKQQEARAAFHGAMAKCNETAAGWQACEAERWKRSGKGAALLCLAGVGLAAVDGGMSAMAACGTGAVVGGAGGYATSQSCGVRPPPCHGPRIPAEILAQYQPKPCGAEPVGCDEFGLSLR